MLKERIQKEEPLVYEMFSNALETKRVPSAILLSGPKGTPKKEAAQLLAMSILCGKNTLACEECETCRRVCEGTYGDYILMDGSQKPISKEDIDAIQETFSRTAFENQDGNRVYVILNFETASISAMNSMLKFLEEPASGVTAILTTDNEDRVLPTILSRCTKIPFVPISYEEKAQNAKESNIKEEDHWFISHLASSLEEMEELAESESYERAVLMLKQYLNMYGLRKELLVDYDISYRFSGGNKEETKKANMELLKMFFDLLSLYAHDVICGDDLGPAWYHEAVQSTSLSLEQCAELMAIAVEEKDRVNRNNDLNLLMDQAFFRLEVLK